MDCIFFENVWHDFFVLRTAEKVMSPRKKVCQIPREHNYFFERPLSRCLLLLSSVKICGASVSRGERKKVLSFLSLFFGEKFSCSPDFVLSLFFRGERGGEHFGKWGCLVDKHGQKVRHWTA